jgi:hypothetical protein
MDILVQYLIFVPCCCSVQYSSSRDSSRTLLYSESRILNCRAYPPALKSLLTRARLQPNIDPSIYYEEGVLGWGDGRVRNRTLKESELQNEKVHKT